MLPILAAALLVQKGNLDGGRRRVYTWCQTHVSSFCVLTGRRTPWAGGRAMRPVYWFASVFAIAIGVGLIAGPRAMAADRPIVPDLELEALKEAVRWPKADVTAVMSLGGRLMAGRRDAEGFAYFRERAASEPSRGLFVALEGVFQARHADSVSLFRRVAWVNDAVAKLDRAVAFEPGLPRYLRGTVLAGLPERFGKAQAAVEDLTWVLDNKERFP